jgi:hypothetical protein
VSRQESETLTDNIPEEPQLVVRRDKEREPSPGQEEPYIDSTKARYETKDTTVSTYKLIMQERNVQKLAARIGGRGTVTSRSVRGGSKGSIVSKWTDKNA